MKKTLSAFAFPAWFSVDKNVGGQAVIEGVMMRSPDKISTSIRRASGEITTRTEPYRSLTARQPALHKPIIRGVIAFFEMLVIGIKALNYSAAVSSADAEKTDDIEGPVSQKTSLALVVTIVFSLGLGVGVFFFLPILITQLLSIQRGAFGFNLMAGLVRVIIFLLYIYSISYFSDIKRIFAYHGAEHKSIFAYEADLPLTIENAAKFPTLHPRCGTSFILIVALIAIFTYSISDTVFALIAGHPPSLLARFVVHFSLLPLVAGVSYELLKLSGKTRNSRLTKILIAPGLWLQKITTKEPDAAQLEVGLAALIASIDQTQGGIKSPRI